MSSGRWNLAFADILVALILAAIFPLKAASTGTATSGTAKHTTTTNVTVQTTCPARKINYLTHSLPQQCLTHSWTSRAQSLYNATDATVSADKPMTNGVIPQETKDISVKGVIHAEGEDNSIKLQDSAEATAATEGSHAFRTDPSPSQATEATPTAESDSPLDNAKFLSFEDWKRQNLAKAGQSAEHLDARAGAGSEQRRRPGPVNQALDFLGEDAEIDLDFGGFVGQGPMQNAPPLRGSDVKDGSTSGERQGAEDSPRDGGNARKRPKDAGRTCKERTNYASYDCAASTLKTNKECKSPSAILVENKDTYMLNVCSAQNKFFIVELCDDILIDTVVLANFEFFSSMFRTFRVSASDRYPVKLDKWREIGTYEAKNSREVQAFLVENPLIWARYVRVEILNHFGNEYYCPVSLFRIHGTTMMEEFNSDLKGSNSDDDAKSEGSGEAEKANDERPVATEKDPQIDISPIEGSSSQSTAAAESQHSSATAAPHLDMSRRSEMQYRDITMNGQASPRNNSAVYQLEILFSELLACPRSYTSANADSFPPTSATPSLAGTSIKTSEIEPSATISSPRTQSRSSNTATHSQSISRSPSQSTSITVAVNSSDVPTASSNASIPAGNGQNTSTVARQSSPTQPQPANPTTQESFFKSVHKRLQLLETNSTLSLRYIEDQSRMLRDAFATVEKRQTAKTTNFLETLNKTVLTELVEFRQQYDQIWQSTVIELSSQREQSQHEVFALSARLSLLADEIVFQKRMAILQFMLMLLCLGVVIFSRSSPTSSFELRPLMQNAFSRSSANLSKYAPLFDTPPSSPSASRPASRYGIFRSFTHRKSPSEESYAQEAVRRPPSIEYSPPTPESQPDNLSSFEVSPGKSDAAGSDVSDGPYEGSHMVRSRSSPATPEVMKEEKRQVRKAAFVEQGSAVEIMTDQRQIFD